MGIQCNCMPILTHTNPVLPITLSSKNCIQTAITLNMKHHNERTWNYFNLVRKNPKKFSETLSTAISSFKSSKAASPLLSPIANYIQSYILPKDDSKRNLTELITTLDALSKNEQDFKFENEIYLSLSSTTSYDVCISCFYQKSIKIISYEVETFDEPEITVLKLLYENKEKVIDMLTSNYIGGIAYSPPISNENDKSKTLFMFFYEVKDSIIVLKGVNPLTGNYQPFVLDKQHTKNFEYQHMIVNGTYVHTAEGVQVTFNLWNGTKREEVLQLDKCKNPNV